jgi:hypothetical protein
LTLNPFISTRNANKENSKAKVYSFSTLVISLLFTQSQLEGRMFEKHLSDLLVDLMMTCENEAVKIIPCLLLICV